jgi:hypothetical protein
VQRTWRRILPRRTPPHRASLPRRATTAPVRAETAVKVGVAGLLFFFFGAFILRAALRLASTAIHSLMGAVVLLGIVLWVLVKTRRA